MAGVVLDAGDLLYYRRKDALSVLAEAVESVTGQHIAFNRRAALLLYELRELSYRGMISRRDAVALFLRALGVEGSLVDEVYARYDREMQEGVVFYDDCVRAVRELKSLGYRVAVLSNSDFRAEEKLGWFARAGLDALLDVVVCSCDIGRCKPEAEAYLYVLGELGVEPGKAAFVGHSVRDLVGAKSVGMVTVAVRCPLSEIPHVDAVAGSLAELPRVVASVLPPG